MYIHHGLIKECLLHQDDREFDIPSRWVMYEGMEPPWSTLVVLRLNCVFRWNVCTLQFFLLYIWVCVYVYWQYGVYVRHDCAISCLCIERQKGDGMNPMTKIHKSDYVSFFLLTFHVKQWNVSLSSAKKYFLFFFLFGHVWKLNLNLSCCFLKIFTI